MATGKPVLEFISDFDATKNKTIYFNYSIDGSYGSEICACDNSEYDVDFENEGTYKSKENKYVIPKNTFVNGNDYRLKLRTLNDEYKTLSNFSDVALIHCRTTPDFYIQHTSTVVSKSFFEAIINYSQKEGMKLNSYKFSLYKNGILVESSDDLYKLYTDIDSTEDEYSYTFKALNNNTTYTLVVNGVTEYGRDLTDTYVFTVKYKEIENTKNLDLSCDNNTGEINITAQNVFIKNIKVYSNSDLKESTAATFKDGRIILADENELVLNGFNLTDDFTIEADLYNLNCKKDTLITLKNSFSENSIKIKTDFYSLHSKDSYTLLSDSEKLPTSNPNFYLDYSSNLIKYNGVYMLRSDEYYFRIYACSERNDSHEFKLNNCQYDININYATKVAMSKGTDKAQYHLYFSRHDEKYNLSVIRTVHE